MKLQSIFDQTDFVHASGTKEELQVANYLKEQCETLGVPAELESFRVAMGEISTYKDTDTTGLAGQLIYAVSADDEVAPAQVLNTFAKDHPELQLMGGFSGEGLALNSDEIKALAGLPSKNQLIAEVVAQLLSPVHDTVNALSGNLHGLLDGIEAKATN